MGGADVDNVEVLQLRSSSRECAGSVLERVGKVPQRCASLPDIPSVHSATNRTPGEDRRRLYYDIIRDVDGTTDTWLLRNRGGRLADSAVLTDKLVGDEKKRTLDGPSAHADRSQERERQSKDEERPGHSGPALGQRRRAASDDERVDPPTGCSSSRCGSGHLTS
jgi:hypothetical protein